MDLIKALEYTKWAEERYLNYCMEVSEEQFNQKLQPINKSLKEILFHLYSSNWGDFHYITDQDFSDEVSIDAVNREELIKRIRNLQNEIIEHVKTGNLEITHKMQEDENDKVVEISTFNLIFNFVTHSAYHRGQMALLLKLIGLDKVDMTDFTPYLYQLGQK
jgi:uncharacterized damage-inducible protein DinB